MIDMDSTVVRVGDNPWASLGDELVILDVARDKYVHLNQVGTLVWERLEQPVRVADLCAMLTRSFDVPPAVCAAEVLAFLHRLEARRLLTVT